MEVYLNADDMFWLNFQSALQQAFDKLLTWAEVNDLMNNKRKTVTMPFKRGGRHIAPENNIHNDIHLLIYYEYEYRVV